MEKIMMPQAESRSADLVNENLEQLKQIFPEVIKEGRVDLEALHDLLGSYADTEKERFGLNWSGKANARREAQKRSTGTLRPCPEESVDWDTTENLYIEGDNLEVLKLLQKSYHKRVKMIYIDPPYNTGKDFVYKDNYNDNLSNYLEQTGQDRRMSTKALSDSDGRYHSNWLNMMYPRLKLARNLLTDDGIIFISIDDNEVDNLKKICNEVFGEENFIECITWNKRIPKNDKGIGNIHEYILLYAKQDAASKTFLMRKDGLEDITELVVKLKKNRIEIKEAEKEIKKLYKKNGYDRGITLYNSLNNEYRLWGKINMSWPNADTFGPTYDVLHPKTLKPVKIPDRGWRWKKETFDQAANMVNGTYQYVEELHDGTFVCGKIWFDKDEKTQPSSITYLDDVNDFLLRSVLSLKSDGGIEIENIFEGKSFFSYPKCTSLLNILLSSTRNSSGVILDFFSGSATTAHAVMQLNAEDGGNRKYICVQIPEETPEDSEARKAKFYTIPEIAKERIRRAGKKILEEQKAKNDGLFAGEAPKLDIGFKVFKLDSSNVNAWDSNPENLEAALHNSLFNIKEDRTEDDLLYEILIKYGIELTEKINRHTIAGKTVYEMGAGSLIVCLADNITTDVAEGIGKLWNEVRPEDENVKCRMVFKDLGFNGSDEMKTNTMLILKQHGITNVASV